MTFTISQFSMTWLMPLKVRRCWRPAKLLNFGFSTCTSNGLLKKFIRAERTENWQLHLKTQESMLPYLAASGHNLCTKSVRIYLERMPNLEEEHPDIYQSFMYGTHVVRRSDRFWTGLSTDLIIEQVFMTSLKHQVD